MSDNCQIVSQQVQFTGCDNGFLENEEITLDGVINYSLSAFRDYYVVSLQFESIQACFMANEKLSWRYANLKYAPNTLSGLFEKQKGFMIQGCYFTSMTYIE